MIRILADINRLVSSNTAVFLEQVEEYPDVYQKNLAAFQNQQDVVLCVRHSAVLQWFKNMASRYPQGAFIFESIDARGSLAQRWQVAIPAGVTNEDILQTGLLALDIQAQPGFSIEDILLAHFYAPIFTAKTFPFIQLPAILEVADREIWKANNIFPLLARTLRTRLQEWKDKARSSEQRQFIDLFAADPAKLKQQLIQFRVLRSYPQLGEALLGEKFPLFNLLKLALEDLQIEEARIPETVLQVTYQLNEQLALSPEDSAALVDRVSGLLMVEFDTIEKQLLSHPDWITTALVEQIESKFPSLARKIRRRWTALRDMIRPPKPELPDLNWDVDTMLTWATGRYLPYQAWCDAQEQFDPELYPIGDRFSEWLVNHWLDLHANSKRMVFNILPNKAVELNKPGYIHLVLVVDNLGWSFSEILRDLFQEQGYFLSHTEPYLAMIPTETEISKKCLLAGGVGYTAIDDKTYKGMIEKGWVPYFSDNAFRYISDIGSLGKIETVDASTYVVNYLAVDKALHKSADEIGVAHRVQIRPLLEKLVENTTAFIEKHALQENIRIHVVSDHGSTRIPASMHNDLDTAFFKTGGFEARSHRYVVVSNERFSDLADNLKVDCFFLPANDYLNPSNVLCARRANRFLPTSREYYIHGGLLPEEVIVPYMAFEPVTHALKDLTVLLKNNMFRYRMETIEVEIGNPNDTAVEQVQINLINSNIESEAQIIALLNGKTKTTLQIKARFKLTSLVEEQTSLRLRMRFRARGETHTIDAQANIVMRKMVEEKSTSLFED